MNYDDYKPKTYIIHPNVSDVGGFNIGTFTFKYRNAIEAGVVFFLMFLFWKLFMGFFSWKVKAVVLVIDVVILLLFIAGIGSDSVGQYIIKIIEFKQSADHIRYRIPRKEEEKKSRRKERKKNAEK